MSTPPDLPASTLISVVVLLLVFAAGCAAVFAIAFRWWNPDPNPQGDSHVG